MTTRSLILEFTKMQAVGNDFVVLDNRFFAFSEEELSRLARRLCTRRFGIGADGLMALDRPASEKAHYRMHFYNADGSRAPMCGNGARCLARFAYRAGLRHRVLYFETDAGLFEAHVPEDPEAPVGVVLDPPERVRLDVPVSTEAAGPVHYIWTSTDHVVCFVPDLSALDVEHLGRLLRHDPAFAPAGTNVNFARVVDGRIQLRTYERGVEGETLGCGTGATAACTLARMLGLVEGREKVAVEMPGGTVWIQPLEDGRLLMEGEAVTVFRGTLELDPAAL